MNEPARVRVPGDKSISHRALMFASFAVGTSRLVNVLPSDDVLSTGRVLRALGCAVPEVPADGREVRIEGVGLRGWRDPVIDLDCGNSGTTARLMLGALAGATGGATLTGDASVCSRPMRRVTAPLHHAGARFTELGAADRLPIRVERGQLRAVEHDSPIASAQVKSALLLAALRAGVDARVTEPRLSRDHTERMLAAMGIGVTTHESGDGRVAIALTAGAPGPLDLTVPGDFSSAAFLLALGLLGERPVRIEGVGLNPTRTGLLPVLRRMGARIEVEEQGSEGGEPVGAICAWPSALHGTAVSGDELPALIDEVPILAVLAARADGETRVDGAAELRVKESDRLAALAANLTALGIDVEEWPEGLAVRGDPRGDLRGMAQARHDHRIAMAFGVLGALPGADIRIDTPDVASVSFPGYWSLLRRVNEGA